VGTRRPAETNEEDLATMMVGREVLLRVDRGTSNVGNVVLRIEALHARDDRRHETVRGADLEVRHGEILGIAGVAGNGQDELVEALVGLRRASGGRVMIESSDVTHASVRAVREHGVAYVPADRQRFGLVLSYPIQDNLVLTSYYRRPFASGIVRNEDAAADFARRLIARFDIRTPSEKTRAATLSGGNQQKIVVAREFRDDLELLILDQPTRGLDIGSIEFIHRQIIAKRDAGIGVLLISADLDEVLELSDRIAVMYRGRLVATFNAAEAQREKIGLLMAVGEAR
jgi:simple sugar transport system ATP-binding protein